MYVYECMCIDVCVYVSISIVCMYVHECMCIDVCVYVSISIVCMYVHECMCIGVCCVCVGGISLVYMDVCIWMCVDSKINSIAKQLRVVSRINTTGAFTEKSSQYS